MKTHASPHCSWYISYGTGKDNLSKNEDDVSLAITSFILITSTLEQVEMM